MTEIEKAISEIIGTNYGEAQCHRKTMILAVQALQEKAERENPKPLTLAELRQMEGEPVWVEMGEVYLSAQLIGKWQIVHSVSDTSVVFMGGGNGIGISDYGRIWLAFRYKPKEG